MSRSLRQEGKRLGLAVAALALEHGPIDRPSVEPGRRPCLETAKGKTQGLQPLPETDGGIFAHAAGRKALGADMNHAPQKRSRRQDEGAAADLLARGGLDPLHPAVFEENIGGLGFDDLEIPGLSDRRLHRLTVELAVGLRPRAAHGGTLGPVQHAKLNAGFDPRPAP